MTTVILTYQRQKLINAILYFARNTEKFGVTKLIKLLYLLDFEHFRLTGKSVTGFTYSAWDFGPVPEPLWHELDKAMRPDLAAAIEVRQIRRFQKIVPRLPYDPQYHTPREQAIMQRLAEQYHHHSADQMVEVTHRPGSPWAITTKAGVHSQPIEYRLILDNRPDSLTPDEANHRTIERQEMLDACGWLP